ncbi:PREDICTED: DNA ligase 4 isoform X2 [Dinoponera quadriceps]|uniref:DNA ligase 4 n=1 Tax=Dinoponera quadriceps TaxID=609295 RepID=A0A6P3X1F8_DINQU|nr:PREDICTED: DNA ligase 4 isoform X2 [Dinoponera quadriceps]
MASSTGTSITFMQLCESFEKVRASRLKQEKIRILETFVDKCKNIADKVENASDGKLDEIMHPIFRLILPNFADDYKETPTSLARLYADVYSLPKQSHDYKCLISDRNYIPKIASNRFEGNDFAERAYSILKKWLPRQSNTKVMIADVNRFLDDIGNKDATKQQKVQSFRIILRQMTGLEMKWLTRIILKDLHLGTRKENILDFLDTGSCSTSWSRWVKDKPAIHSSLGMKPDVQLFTHFKPMLLERLNIDDGPKLFSTPAQYYVQVKYDGERSQIHMSRGRYTYFTRNGFDITKRPLLGETESLGYLSGKFARFLDPDCFSFILDGELMVWDKGQKALLTKGMNVDVKFLKANGPYRPCFVAFDIIMHNDTLLLDTPYHMRVTQLQSLLSKARGALSVSEVTLIKDTTQLGDIFRSKCLQEKEEGIVVKRYDFLYKPGVRDGGGCYKIKAEYSDNLVQDLDLIILGGCYTIHKSPRKLNSLLMGAALPASNREERPSEFVEIVSVSNGLSNEEWDFLEEKFSPKWLEERPASVVCSKKSQPDAWLRPEDSVILTIRATEMVPSHNYPLKYSFRFPRVTHIRKDKPWYSVCTSTEILSLVKEKGTIHKLIKVEATLENDEKLIRVPKRTSDKPRTRARPQSERIAHVLFKTQVIHTRRLEGKEICVINGTEDFPEEKIQETLGWHSAKIVKYPTPTTYCTIVGKTTTIRALDAIKNHDNVVSFDWFLRIIRDPKSSISFHPWELLSKRKHSPDSPEEYDMYFDYYQIDATASTLKHSFVRIDELGQDAKPFRETPSPCMFRNVNGFFSEKMIFEQLVFRDQAGTIKENFEDSVTHVFVKDQADRTASDLKVYERAGAKIVKSEWITECFFQDRFLNVEDYLIDFDD